MISTLKSSHWGILIGIGVAITGLATYTFFSLKKSGQIKNKTLLDCIGKTPLIYLDSLSEALQCQIYCKAEHLNPFGSSKDRAVYRMLKQAQKKGIFNETKDVVEASSGSTAISLVHICKLMGLKPNLYLPDDLAQQKYSYLNTLGAKILKVPQVSIVDPNHFFKLAESSSILNKQFFTNQFQNLDNFRVHFQQTGPQIYQQTKGRITSFVCSAGTGGTIAGVSRYLKQQNPNIQVILADPEGSGLYNKVNHGVLYTKQQKEGYRLKNPFDTIVEGVGLNRSTKNFQQAIIDQAEKVSDQEALHMAYYLIQNEGLFVGSSSALNLAAVVKHVRKNKQKNSVIVTVSHDSGTRYMSKFYNANYLNSKRILFEKRPNYHRLNLDFIQ